MYQELIDKLTKEGAKKTCNADTCPDYEGRLTSLLADLSDRYPQGDKRAESLWRLALRSLRKGDLAAAQAWLSQSQSKIPREVGWDLKLLSWAFLFVGERCFEGTRAFATQGIDKPIFNLLRMYARMGDQLVNFTSGGARDTLAYADAWGDAEPPDLGGFATAKDDGSVQVLRGLERAVDVLHAREQVWRQQAALGANERIDEVGMRVERLVGTDIGGRFGTSDMLLTSLQCQGKGSLSAVIRGHTG
mgnify:CR=1 FL=1